MEREEGGASVRVGRFSFRIVARAAKPRKHSTAELIAHGIRRPGVYESVVRAIVSDKADSEHAALVRSLAVGKRVWDGSSEYWLFEQTGDKFRAVVPPRRVGAVVHNAISSGAVPKKGTPLAIERAMRPMVLNVVARDVAHYSSRIAPGLAGKPMSEGKQELLRKFADAGKAGAAQAGTRGLPPNIAKRYPLSRSWLTNRRYRHAVRMALTGFPLKGSWSNVQSTEKKVRKAAREADGKKEKKGKPKGRKAGRSEGTGEEQASGNSEQGSDVDEHGNLKDFVAHGDEGLSSEHSDSESEGSAKTTSSEDEKPKGKRVANRRRLRRLHRRRSDSESGESSESTSSEDEKSEREHIPSSRSPPTLYKQDSDSESEDEKPERKRVANRRGTMVLSSENSDSESDEGAESGQADRSPHKGDDGPKGEEKTGEAKGKQRASDESEDEGPHPAGSFRESVKHLPPAEQRRRDKEGLIENIDGLREDLGASQIEVVNVPGDGSCLFHAASASLKDHGGEGRDVSGSTLRAMTVNWMEKHRYATIPGRGKWRGLEEGPIDLLSLAELPRDFANEPDPKRKWKKYIERIRDPRVFADTAMVVGLSSVLGREIGIVESPWNAGTGMGKNKSLVVTPPTRGSATGPDKGRIYIASMGSKEHYLGLKIRK